MHIFNENIEDPFENEVCKENYAVYDTLPVVDGYLYSGNGIRSSVYFYDKATNEELSYNEMIFEDKGNGECEVKFDSVIFKLTENQVEITADRDIVIKNIIGRKCDFSPEYDSVLDNKLILTYKGNNSSINLANGKFVDENTIESVDLKIKTKFILF